MVQGVTLTIDGLVGLLKALSAATVPSRKHEPWISISQGAKYAGVGTSTLREWVARGELPAGRHHGTVRVRASDIDALLLREAPKAASGQPHPRALEIVSAAKGGKNDG